MQLPTSPSNNRHMNCHQVATLQAFLFVAATGRLESVDSELPPRLAHPCFLLGEILTVLLISPLLVVCPAFCFVCRKQSLLLVQVAAANVAAGEEGPAQPAWLPPLLLVCCGRASGVRLRWIPSAQRAGWWRSSRHSSAGRLV